MKKKQNFALKILFHTHKEVQIATRMCSLTKFTKAFTISPQEATVQQIAQLYPNLTISLPLMFSETAILWHSI